jgi:hypothetical protein
MKTIHEEILISLYCFGGKQLLALLIMSETLRVDERDYEHNTTEIDQDIPTSESDFHTASDRQVDRDHRLRLNVVTRHYRILKYELTLTLSTMPLQPPRYLC